MAKSEEISASNKRILKEYVVTSLLAKTPKLSKHTLIYNIKIIKFVLNNVSNNSDKLTNTDIVAFNTAFQITLVLFYVISLNHVPKAKHLKEEIKQ